MGREIIHLYLQGNYEITVHFPSLFVIINYYANLKKKILENTIFYF